MKVIHQDQLNEILRDHERWLDRRGGKRAVFEYCDLSGLNFDGRNLTGAFFLCSDLSDSSFVRTALIHAGFYKCDLERSSFYEANLEQATLRSCALSNAALLTTVFDNCECVRTEFTGGMVLAGRATRSDGYEFFAWAFALGATHLIRAGCRTFTLDEFREHVAFEYPDSGKAEETLAILEYLEGRINAQFDKWRALDD